MSLRNAKKKVFSTKKKKRSSGLFGSIFKPKNRRASNAAQSSEDQQDDEEEAAAAEGNDVLSPLLANNLPRNNSKHGQQLHRGRSQRPGLGGHSRHRRHDTFTDFWLTKQQQVLSPVLREMRWDDRNHWAVLTQLYGSVWPRVLPLCLWNAFVCVALHFLENSVSVFAVLESTSTTGHRYLAMVMSLLVVTRVKITYDRYMAQSSALQACYRSVRELCGTVCLVTGGTDPDATQYRHDVCAAAIHLLAVTMQVLELRSRMYASHDDNDGLALPDHLNMAKVVQVDHIKNPSGRRDSSWSSSSSTSTSFLRIHNKKDTNRPTPMQLLQHACRVPLVHAWRLRQIILSPRVDPTRFVDNAKVWLHPCNEELRLCAFVDDFVAAHATLEIYMTSPLPFPLVQMTKTFIFVWLLTLPLVFHVTETSQLVVSTGMVVLITYGWVWLAGLFVCALCIYCVFFLFPYIFLSARQRC